MEQGKGVEGRLLGEEEHSRGAGWGEWGLWGQGEGRGAGWRELGRERGRWGRGKGKEE